MKYIIYLRVSTEQQAQSGLGLEAQRRMCHEYINDKHAKIIEFADEGLKGALPIEKRPALVSALNSLEKDDILLIAKRDRIGRDPIINAMIERMVERKKARLISASRDVSDDNDPSSILMKRIVDAFAEYERLIIGARTKAALQVKKRKNQCVGHVPYGFKKCEDNIHLEPNEKEQITLSMINEMRRNGYTFRQISHKLNQNENRNRNGNIWNHVSVSRVMK